MKVTVVSRSGREVVKGGIDLKESVRAPAPAPLPPGPLDLGPEAGFHPAGFHGGGFVSSSGFKISRRGLESDCLLGPCVQAKVADLQEAIHARSKWIRLLALIFATCCNCCTPFVR